MAYRSCASRAYYSAYHAALTAASKKGFAPEGRAADHTALRNFFKDRGKLRWLAEELAQLYHLREWGDYGKESGYPDSSDGALADWALDIAHDILTANI